MDYYVIDTFTDALFGGNPAGVCVLDTGTWPDDTLLLNIAMENNMPETAFLLPRGQGYGLRWFSPSYEVDLCGHATLAAAHVVGNILHPDKEYLRFFTKSGELLVCRHTRGFTLQLPSYPAVSSINISSKLEKALGCPVLETYRGQRDVLAVLSSAQEVQNLIVDFSILNTLPDIFNLCVTAKGDGLSGPDFVSRLFSPNYPIPEDSVCGSAHCMLVPFWAKRLGKKTMLAHQLSARGGALWVEDKGEYVSLSGHSILYMSGKLQLGRQLGGSRDV